jgi:hypothetical protein
VDDALILQVLEFGERCRLRAMEGCADLMTRLNLRARLAKRLVVGADRALGSAAEHVWKALRMIVAMYYWCSSDVVMIA